LPDGVETNSGEHVDSSETGTSPTLVETDGDGCHDGAKTYTRRSDPTDPFDYPGAPSPWVPAPSPPGLGLPAGELMLAAARATRMPRVRRSWKRGPATTLARQATGAGRMPPGAPNAVGLALSSVT